METMGARIRMCRKGFGFTQEELAKRVGGVDKSTVSQWEKDKTQPNRDNLTRLCGIFGKTTEWFQFGDERASTALSDDETEITLVMRAIPVELRQALMIVARGLVGNDHRL